MNPFKSRERERESGWVEGFCPIQHHLQNQKAVVEEIKKQKSMAARLSTIISLKVNGSSRKAPGRRQLLLLSSTTAILLDSKTDLINKYLKKSQENKDKNDKERLDSYYKRNYKDYFGLLEGDLKQKKELSESEKGILEWLEANK